MHTSPGIISASHNSLKREILCSLSILILVQMLLSGCTKTIPREDLPYPLTNESFGDPVKVVTVPLPVIASTPNEGLTSGAIDRFSAP